MVRLYILTFVLDAIAIGLSIYAGIIQHRANIRLETAIKELHESHVELHALVERVK